MYYCNSPSSMEGKISSYHADSACENGVETCRRIQPCQWASINILSLEFTDTREHNSAALYVPQNRILFMTEYAWTFTRECVRACVRACVLSRFNAVSNERSSVHILTQIVVLQFENLSSLPLTHSLFQRTRGAKGKVQGKKKYKMKENNVEAIINY
jgi:hypothetical protein